MINRYLNLGDKEPLVAGASGVEQGRVPALSGTPLLRTPQDYRTLGQEESEGD